MPRISGEQGYAGVSLRHGHSHCLDDKLKATAGSLTGNHDRQKRTVVEYFGDALEAASEKWPLGPVTENLFNGRFRNKTLPESGFSAPGR